MAKKNMRKEEQPSKKAISDVESLHDCARLVILDEAVMELDGGLDAEMLAGWLEEACNSAGILTFAIGILAKRVDTYFPPDAGFADADKEFVHCLEKPETEHFYLKDPEDHKKWKEAVVRLGFSVLQPDPSTLCGACKQPKEHHNHAGHLDSHEFTERESK